MSLGTFGHQVTPESGRAGPMGGRLSNWIDNEAQMTPHSSLHEKSNKERESKNYQTSERSKELAGQKWISANRCLSAALLERERL